MTTRIELRGAHVGQWLTARHIEHDASLDHSKNGTFVVGEFPDTAGVYDTKVGQVGVDFSHRETSNGEIYVGRVNLDVSNANALRGIKHRNFRTVEIKGGRFGSQQLTTGVDIFVSTHAFKKK